MNEKISECQKNLKTVLKKWKFPSKIIDKYDEIGIKDIFDWQAELLNNTHVSESKQNLVYSAPTSAGKSLVAELFMLKNVLEWRRKAIMIFPYVSLANEKLKHLQFVASESFLRIGGFIGNSSPGGGFASVDVAICTIEKANSLLNRLIEEDSIYELGVIVIDELHMINDSSRGYLLELILSKIKYLCAKTKNNLKAQIIGMSATLPNLRAISEWLDAILYQTDFRPVSLIECLKYENYVYDKNHAIVERINVDPRIENDPDHLAHLVLETIVNKLGVLVFCPTKARCETLAEHLARTIYNLEKHHNEVINYLNKDKLVECLNELKNTPAGLDSQLAKTVRYGIAFHHAGLTMEEREVLENHFKKGDLLVIMCTSTLSSGINFPARRVIIRTPIFNGRPIDPMSYKQMAGRAGRKGIDSIGESILMCSNVNEKKVAESLLNCSQIQETNFASHLEKNSSTDTSLNVGIKRALLETIVSGIANTKREVIEYVNCFLSSRLENGDSYERYLKWLNQNQFVDIAESDDGQNKQEHYKPTQLAYGVVAAAMSPDEGLIIFGELQKAMQCFVLENELHIIYQITPISICDNWINSSNPVDWNLFYTVIQNFSADFKRVSDLVGVRQSFLLKMIKGGTSVQTCDQKLLRIHLRFFTCLILHDLVNEMPFASILAKYGCQKGFLQTLQQSASTYSAMITAFCNRLGWFNLEMLVNQFQSRLTFGVQRQLVDLVRIKLLNSYRARLFYNAGFTTVASVAMCDIKKCEKILRSGLTFVAAKSTTEKTTSEENNKINKNSSESVIWHDGKGYTYWQAANEILKEANDLLRSDLEQMGVKLDRSCDPVVNKTNRSVFRFDDSVSSVTLQHSQSRASQSPQPFHQERTREDPNSIKEKTKEMNTEEKENLDDIRMETTSEEINGRILNSMEVFQIKDHLLEQVDEEKVTTGASLETTSFIDDRAMLKVVENFEKVKSSVTKSTSIQKNINMNTTVVSQEVLNMCDVFEKNVLSGKKHTTNEMPKQVLTQSARKSLNYSFGENTLKNVINSPKCQDIDNDELKRIFATQVMSVVECGSNDKQDISEFLKTLNLTSLNINIINDLSSLKCFCQAIKSKAVLSLSLVCNTIEKEKGENQLPNYYLDFYDEQKNCYFRLFGIFICMESEKLEQVHLILIRPNQEYLYMIRELLGKYDLIKIVFFAQKHAKILYKSLNIALKSPCYDPIIASWLLNQEQLNIFQVCQKYGANLKISIDTAFKALKSCFGCYNRVELDVRMAFKGALIECVMALACFDKIKMQLQLENIWIYFTKVETEIALLSAKIELTGLGIDVQELDRMKNLLIEKKKEIEDRASVYISGDNNKKANINLNAPDDIAFVLFNKLKLKPPGADEKSAFFGIDKRKHHSTSKEVLLQLASQHDFPKLITLAKSPQNSPVKSTAGRIYTLLFSKLKSKVYSNKMKMYRIHPTIDLFTATGRMNFYNPCLQNIPRDFEISTENLLGDNCLQIEAVSNNALGISSELNDDAATAASFLEKIDDKFDTRSTSTNSISLRNSFICSNGHVLLAADYCQLELRVITNLCRDESLIRIFNDNTNNDVFNMLASKWLNLPIEQIDDVKRQNVKKVIYGIIYGISAKTLSTFLGLSENEASSFIESFKCTFPGLKSYINKLIETCRTKGYVETIRKRRRYLPNISSLDHKQRSQAERQAVNTVVQGSASDLVKSAMIKIEKTLRKEYPNPSHGAFMVMQLHDEVIYEVYKKDLNEVQTILRDCMENCMDLPVKMKIKMKVGSAWGSLSSI